MLRNLKLQALHYTRLAGLQRPVLTSNWRRNRLCILCYHGVSLEDEHLWRPRLYLTRETLQRRFQILADSRCNVLPLGEAIQRLYAGTLPPASVALTFDDGNYDFYRQAFPLLRNFGFPATVYLTTYYSCFNRPVFDVMASLLLFRSSGRVIDWPEMFGSPVQVTPATQPLMERILRSTAASQRLSGEAKDQLLRDLARRVGIDYDDILSRRLLHIMTVAEAQEVAAAGIDIQLHTHRHRVSQQPDLFAREISDNRKIITSITPRPATHFCYPAGFSLPQFPDWLERAGVESATTCQIGLANATSDRYMLPRVLDASHVTDDEFYGWVSGAAAFLPKRNGLADNPLRSHQLMERAPDPLDQLHSALREIAETPE